MPDHYYFPAFSLDVDEHGGILISTTVEWLWHRRLGHPGNDAMHRLIKGNMVENLPLNQQQVKRLENIPCDACHKAKAKRLPFLRQAPQRYMRLCNAFI